MNENNNIESRDHFIKNNVDEDPVFNLASNLFESENTLDKSEITIMTTNLLQNESFMNFVKDISQFVQIPILNPPENQIVTQLKLLKEELMKMENKIMKVNKELTDIKKENNYLVEIIDNIEKHFKTDGTEPIM